MAISDNPNTLSGGPDPKFPGPDNRNVRVSANAGSAVRGSLSGPDSPGTSGPPVRGGNNAANNLSGPDVINNAKATGGGGSAYGGGKVNPGLSPGNELPGHRDTGGTTVPLSPNIRPLPHGGNPGEAPPGPSPVPVRRYDPYYFHGSMSEEVLHNYLDRALHVTALSTMCCYDGATGPSYYYTYNSSDGPSYPDNPSYPLFDSGYDHGRLLQMIVELGTKFVWDMVWLVNVADWYIDFVCQTLAHDINYIHAYDPDIICNATLGESVYPGVNTVAIPPATATYPDIVAMFYPSGRPSTSTPGYFDVTAMNIYENCPDITQPETRMWYYYLATRYIDAGCEAIGLGEFPVVCRRDKANGYPYLWSLCQLIRAYGATHTNRGLVLIHIGFHPDLTYFDPYGPLSPLSPWERQIICDFSTYGVIYTPCCSEFCIDGGVGSSSYPGELLPGGGSLDNTLGGLHPQGWRCNHSPGLSFFDNGGINPSYGCDSDWMPVSYGFDDTSWFVWQAAGLRTRILLYIYYRIKCIDPYNHFLMPGRVFYREPTPAPDHFHTLITFNAFFYNSCMEAPTIAAIWNDVYAGPSDWVYHNFTFENAALCPANVSSGLVFVGTNTMYYIADDGTIYSHILVAGSSYNGGVWLFANVAYGAYLNGASMASQVKAASALVASPDGNTLLYIGVDGYLHGYNIIAPWNYTYFDFQKDQMISAEVTYPLGQVHIVSQAGC